MKLKRSLKRRLLISLAWALFCFLLGLGEFYFGDFSRPVFSALYFGFMTFILAFYYLTWGHHFRRKVIDPGNEWASDGKLWKILILGIIGLLLLLVFLTISLGPLLLINML